MKRLAVLGHPVAHSRSPAMQSAALGEAGLGEEWSYEAIDVEPAGLADLLARMPGEGFVGANVTVPHKVAALALADRATPRAVAIGAANTLTFTENGIEAENTDAPGLIAALVEAGQRSGSAAGQAPTAHPAAASLVDSRALVLGAGGAARAAVWALLDAGAGIAVWNRTPERAEALCADLGGTPLSIDPATTRPPVSAAGQPPAGPPPSDPELSAAEYDLIVNCTAAGLAGEDPFAALPLEPAGFRAGQTVVDMVYSATAAGSGGELLAAARAAGATVIDGLEILVRQGALSFEIWTGRPAALEPMRRAARDVSGDQ